MSDVLNFNTFILFKTHTLDIIHQTLSAEHPEMPRARNAVGVPRVETINYLPPTPRTRIRGDLGKDVLGDIKRSQKSAKNNYRKT